MTVKCLHAFQCRWLFHKREEGELQRRLDDSIPSGADSRSTRRKQWVSANYIPSLRARCFLWQAVDVPKGCGERR